MNPIQIVFDIEAEKDLKLIFDFLKIKSEKGAKSVLNDIIFNIKNIRFVTQYQLDEFLGTPYRRIIVRNYKIIYKVQSESEIRIVQIFDCRKNPK